MENKFKTDGIRGVAQKELNPELFYKIGCYLGNISDFVVVGKDTRESGTLYVNSLINGLISCGCDVFNLSSCTTPSLSILTKHYNAKFGIMITASHNPYEYNGIKIVNNEGEKISLDLQNELNKIINDNTFKPNYKIKIGKIYDKSKYLIDIYLKQLFEEFDLDGFENTSFLIDASNGGGFNLLPALFKGFNLNNYFSIGCVPNGNNINLDVGSLYIKDKRKLLVSYACDYGFALDGDGDRLIGINPKIVLDGDILSYLIIKYNLTNYLSGCVITPLTNRKIKDLLNKLNIPVYESKVGDQNVARLMKEKGANIGFEKSGHIMFKNHPCDGLYSLCKFLETLKAHRKEIEDELNTIKLNPSKMINIKAKDKNRLKEIINNETVLNEVRRRLGNKCYLFIRESGTEDLLRVYLESSSANDIEMAESYFLEKVQKYVWNSWGSK